MNCCCLLILLLLFGGNNSGMFCCNRNGSDHDHHDHHCHDDHRPAPLSSPAPCGCNDDLIQPRGFSGFSNAGTCGCEEKND